MDSIACLPDQPLTSGLIASTHDYAVWYTCNIDALLNQTLVSDTLKAYYIGCMQTLLGGIHQMGVLI